mmetsp:Transcript_52888/g.84268  ORF Transcript_52888/g.84268 Transcript_52888/m.84268 type:complete len:120 (-) Transcript_52888:380-739(-)
MTNDTQQNKSMHACRKRMEIERKEKQQLSLSKHVESSMQCKQHAPLYTKHIANVAVINLRAAQSMRSIPFLFPIATHTLHAYVHKKRDYKAKQKRNRDQKKNTGFYRIFNDETVTNPTN